MKKIDLKAVILLLSLALLISCEKDSSNVVDNNQSPYLTVQKLGVGTMANLDPELIQVIKNQMVEQGRAQDTTRLLNTYDAKTGKLRIDIKGAINDSQRVRQNCDIDSTQITELSDTVASNLKSNPLPWDNKYLKIQAHCAGWGWTGHDPNGIYGTGPVGANQFVGSKGQHRRMEAFIISYDNIDPLVIPDIRYQAKTYESGWLKICKWTEVAGTTGYHNTMTQLKVWSVTPGYTTEYWVHQEGFGDSPVYCNGQATGPATNKRIEGMALDIYKW